MQRLLVRREKESFVGKALKPVEDRRFITGEAKYTADIQLRNMHYMGILRSIHPHAMIKKVDVTDAIKVRGVKAAFTGSDVRRLSNPIYQWYRLKGLKTANVYALAAERVRYVGEPVAAVVSADPYTLEDAIETISVDYEPLEPIVTIEDAVKEDAPLLYDEWKTNVILEYSFSGGNVGKAFDEAHRIIEEDIGSHRYGAAPLETRSYLASYDPPNLSFWGASQQPYQTRMIISKTIGIAEQYVNVHPVDLGGGFGAKQPTYHEEPLTALASMKLKVPVLFVEDRRENLVSMHQAREQTHHIELALTREGRILAARDKILANLGAYLPTVGPGSVIVAGKYLPGAYKIQNYSYQVIGVVTNKAPYGALRGYGKDAANYVIERMMYIAARELGIDPIEMRMRNIIHPYEMPYRSVTGSLYDSGDYPSCLTSAVKLIGYDKVDLLKESYGGRNRVGVGITLTVEATAPHNPGTYTMGYEAATIRIEPSGEATVLVGSISMGTGHETFISQIVAEELGLQDIERVRVVESDTRAGPFGFGSWGSRTTVSTGGAVALAARDLRKKILSVASRLLNADPSNLDTGNGRVSITGQPEKFVTVEDIARTVYTYEPPSVMEGIEPGLEVTRHFMPECIESVDKPGIGRNSYGAHGNSVHCSVVEVDEETGVIKVLRYLVLTDCGRIINPVIVGGQVIGGVIQGLGGTIYEENPYSSTGQPLATTFMDYLTPSAMESPNVEVHLRETPSPFNPLGVKGVGEGPMEGVTATIINAVEDALSHQNVRIKSTPLTPEKILALLNKTRNQTHTT